jgi:hypothetical protein
MDGRGKKRHETASDHLNTSKTHSREAVSPLADRLARRGRASLGFREMEGLQQAVEGAESVHAERVVNFL